MRETPFATGGEVERLRVKVLTTGVWDRGCHQPCDLKQVILTSGSVFSLFANHMQLGEVLYGHDLVRVKSLAHFKCSEEDGQ